MSERHIADVPRAIKGYELQEKIGEGGFGAVYRAFQPSVGREVAIKIILPQYANHPDFIRRFESEAQLVARLEHFHIVPLYDYWREPDGAYLVMRYLRGGSLYGKIKSGGPLGTEEVIKLIDQITAALDLAHRNGVIHRDLKPSNILLDDENNYYLTDFGIAKDLGNMALMTAPSEVVITPAYASPEQVRREIVAPQTDIYALGVVLFEALSGRHPFAGFSSGEIVAKHLNEVLPNVCDTCPELPEFIDGVIQQATAKDVRQRYGTVREFATAVHEAFADRRGRDGEPTHTPLDLGLPVTNPYKGLRPFDEADAGDFFGREALTEQLLYRLQEEGEYSRFLAVVGPSGSGKSSVVRAGLIPAMRQGKLAGSENWYIAGMLPGSHPVEEIELAFARIASAPINLLPILQENERGLVRATRQILPTNDSQLLLIIDQFEEVFTLVDDAARARQFMDLIVAAVTDPRSPIRVIITLRADFYDRPLMIPDFSAMVSQRTQVVIPMTPDELERAICAPAERSRVQLERGLVAEMVTDVNEQPGALPMLQYALTELFDHREDHTLTLESYHAIGGTLGALTRRADDVYDSLNDDQQAAARQLFLRLVTLGEGTEDSRRRALRSELVSAGGAVMDSVIDQFDQSRLLTFDRDPLTREPTVEVAHEAILREWGQLQNWLDESRHDIRQQRMLANAAADWLKATQDESYLLRGTRLEQFAAWSKVTEIALTEAEQSFLETSVTVETGRHMQRRRIRNAVLVSAILLSVVMTILAISALNARSTAENERDKAEREALVNRSLVLAANAETEAQGSDTDLALLLALEAVSIEDPPPEAVHALSTAAFGPGNRAILVGHQNEVRSVAFGPMGQRGVSGSCAALFEGNCNSGELIIWDLEAEAIVHRVEGHLDWINSVAFSPDGQSILSGGGDGLIILWDSETGTPIRNFEGHSDAVNSVSFSSDGLTAISGSTDSTLILWDIETGSIIRRFEGHTGGVNSVMFSPDGRTVASGSDDTSIILWNVETGDVQQRLEGAVSRVMAVGFTPDGHNLITGEIGSLIRIWDVETGILTHEFNRGVSITYLSLAPNGRTGIIDGANSVEMWDIEKMQTIRNIHLSQHNETMMSGAISHDSQLVLTGTDEGNVYLWNLGYSSEINRIAVEGVSLFDFDLSTDGSRLITGTWGGNTAILWNLDTAKEMRRFQVPYSSAYAVTFSPDDGSVLVGSSAIVDGAEGTDLQLWNLESDQPIHTLNGHRCYVRSLAFSPDGTQMLNGSQCYSVELREDQGTGALILWDVESGEQIRRFENSDDVSGIAFSANGQWALTSSVDGLNVTLWDVASGSAITRYEIGDSLAFGVVFGPNEQTAIAATGIGHNGLIEWDINTGQEIRRLSAGQTGDWSVAISPNRQYLAAGDADGDIVVWDYASGNELHRFTGHSGVIFRLEFSPDSQTLFSTGQGDGTIRQWQVTDWSLDALMDWIEENRYIRDFTCGEREQYRIEPYCE